MRRIMSSVCAFKQARLIMFRSQFAISFWIDIFYCFLNYNTLNVHRVGKANSHGMQPSSFNAIWQLTSSHIWISRVLSVSFVLNAGLKCQIFEIVLSPTVNHRRVNHRQVTTNWHAEMKNCKSNLTRSLDYTINTNNDFDADTLHQHQSLSAKHPLI